MIWVNSVSNFPDGRFVKKQHPCLYTGCWRGLKLIHHYLPAVAYGLLNILHRRLTHCQKWVLNPQPFLFLIVRLNDETNLMPTLLVAALNETHSVCYFLPLIRNKTNPLKLESLFANVVDVWLSLLLSLQSGFLCACQGSFKNPSGTFKLQSVKRTTCTSDSTAGKTEINNQK